MTIEVCANSFMSASEAHKGGAQRVELCQNLENGGTTPSAATIQLSTELLKPKGLEVFVLIRPRVGNFQYSEHEFEVMKRNVLFCKKNNVDGVVLGILTPEGSVDLDRMAKLVKLAQPMQVTFHRAFDYVTNPFEAMEQIIKLGIQRILTSGQRVTALEGSDKISQLIKRAKGRIVIMPGSGINSKNINKLADLTKAKEFHLSAKKKITESSNHKEVENLEYSYFQTDGKEVERVVKMLNSG